MHWFKKKKNFVICANCQGDALLHYLRQIPELRRVYRFKTITNYVLIEAQKEVPYRVLERADVFLYQPVDPVHGKYATANLATYLKPSCIQISFPYIYNNGFWPFYLDHDNGEKNQIGIHTLSFFDKGTIRALVQQGMSSIEIMNAFQEGALINNYQEKFTASLAILRAKEASLDVRVSEVIERQYKKERLFYNFQHPTRPVLLSVISQIMKKLGMSYDEQIFQVGDRYSYDGKFLPVLPEVARGLGLQYYDTDSTEYFTRLLEAVLHSGQFDGIGHDSIIRKKFYNVHVPIRI